MQRGIHAAHAVFALVFVADAHFCRGVNVAAEVATSAAEERKHDHEQDAPTLTCTGLQQAIAGSGPSFGFVYAASSAEWSGYSRQYYGYNRSDIDSTNYLRHALESALALGPNFNVTVFTDSPAACVTELATMNASHMTLACCKASSTGGQGFRFAKVDSFRDSPYDITVFMDADTMPCYSADKFAPQLKKLLSAQGDGVDIAGVPVPHIETVRGALDVLPGVNTGVLGMRTSSARARSLVAKWKEDLIKAYSHPGAEFAMDQPIFKRLLLTSEYKLRFYPLPTAMNCKVHSKKNPHAHCCAAENKCVIDHHCKAAARNI